MNHCEECLLVWVCNHARFFEHALETLFNELRHFGRPVDSPLNGNRYGTKAARRLRVGEKIVREEGVEVKNGVPVHAHLWRLLNQKLNGVLVIDDHLGFARVLPRRCFA